MAPSAAQLSHERDVAKSELQDPSLLGEQDLSQIWLWNKTLPPEIDKSIHEWFIEYAQRDPERPAIVSWDGQLSYGELDQLSSQLAHLLMQIGVKVGVTVPFCFEKSMWPAVAVLAVMKAGGTFVLTDPTQPESRLRTVAMEVKAEIVLTSEPYRELGAQIAPSAQVIAVGPALLKQLNTYPTMPTPSPPGSSTMYIIFTSGSTGKPKGVVISYANYTSGAIPRAEIVGYREHTRVLDFASYAFDVSIDCMLLTLATGGCVCIPSEDARVNNLSGAIRDMRVNMVHTTPSVARVFDPDIIPSLEVLGLGGEAISPHDASNWGQQTQVVVAYGPSECTVGCAFNNEVTVGGTYTSLGKGVGGLLWIVDPYDHNQLMPIGEIGELLVEGPVVGQGYINAPEKTAAVYIEDPAWLSEGHASILGRRGRLYKTGDLVHYDPDGSGAVVFIGRKDQQIKLRGQRVELGEVEHHVRSKLPQQTGVVAEVITPAGRGDATLVAFVAENTQDNHHENGSSPLVPLNPKLRETLIEADRQLATEIPKYMIPAAYIPVKEIPIMVTGKTDRKQLRALGSEMTRKELARLRITPSERREPQTKMERKLSELWVKLLGEGPDVGLDDNFFALGGDSLKAMRLVASAREQSFSLTVAGIFVNPTLAAMASTVSELNEKDTHEVPAMSLIGPKMTAEFARIQAAKMCAVELSSIEDVYLCTPLQEGLMALSARVPEAYVAQRVLKLPSAGAADELRAAFNQAAFDSPILRTRIAHVSGHGLMQVVTTEKIPWRFGVCLDEYLSTDRCDLMALGTPLVRCGLIAEPETASHFFALTMHHALYDGWSMPLIVDRVNRACRGLSTERPAGFKNFVKYLCDMDRGASEVFWREQLHGVSPRQFPCLPEPNYQTQPDSLLERYVALPNASASTNTLATVIRAGWGIVASQLSGSDDVVFGETLTGRNAPIPGVEKIEGPMITTVPVRVRLLPDMTTSELLQGIQQHTISRIPHEHIGLHHIRRLSSDSRKACDLRTGLVLHPHAEEDGVSERGLADGLVPAGDAEAAQEALKFNSYALMLVCTLDPAGFLVMASFDSRAVPDTVMQKALERFEKVVQKLCQSSVFALSEVCALTEEEAAELTVLRLKWFGSNDKLLNTAPTCSNSKPTAGHQLVTDNLRQDGALNEQQQMLADIWSRILGIEEIALHDSFFDLGGDSIGAMKLVSEVRQNEYLLTVAQVFAHRRLDDMTKCLQRRGMAAETDITKSTVPYAALQIEDRESFVESRIRPALSWPDEKILDVLPARPLQEIAVEGTVKMPRYSARYELLFFESTVNKKQLLKACRQLVADHEILRTVFVKVDGSIYGLPIRDLNVPVDEHLIDTNVTAFSHAFCDLDSQTLMPFGQPFLKFVHVQANDNTNCLIIRISHAQYDEMCLPTILRQLSGLYKEQKVEPLTPFSAFIRHVHDHAMSQSIPYWRNLLAGGTITTLPIPSERLTSKAPGSLTRRLHISKRTKNFTLATFPTAAWALTLARRLGTSDVVFGEVVSGRNLDGLTDGDRVMGPCWQYIPVRIQFQPSWTTSDLLSAVQEQHITSARYSALGLSEILEHCVEDTFDPSKKRWYDSVVHQAVQGIETLDFGGVLEARIETIYPHLEPLREWKVQSFVEEGGKAMTLEIVTFEERRMMGLKLLDELVRSFEDLISLEDTRILGDGTKGAAR